jgi:hypothetical protein
MRDSRGRGVGDGLLAAWWLLFALWVIATVGFVAALIVGRLVMSPTLSCALNPETSNYGQAHWSWDQLGTVCEWNLGTAGTFERGPGMSRWAVAVALAGMGAAVVLAGQVIRRARRSSQGSPLVERSDVPV